MFYMNKQQLLEIDLPIRNFTATSEAAQHPLHLCDAAMRATPGHLIEPLECALPINGGVSSWNAKLNGLMEWLFWRKQAATIL